MRFARADHMFPYDLADTARLWDELETSCDRCGPHHVQTLTIAHALAVSLWRTGETQNAAVILKQAVDCLTSSFGMSHPATFAAKGDFAAILIDLGRDAEGQSLEIQAFEGARQNLGTSHPVTTILAWNRVLNFERDGNLSAATAIVKSELAWLLTAPPGQLPEGQINVRTMLIQRLNWDTPKSC